jgi:hypothetical protein
MRCEACNHTVEEHEQQGWACGCTACPGKHEVGSTRWTFERACLAGKFTGEMLNQLGPAEAVDRIREALKPSGWTISELADEARRRMHEYIAYLEAQEQPK